jgi:hypothetical protein
MPNGSSNEIHNVLHATTLANHLLPISKITNAGLIVQFSYIYCALINDDGKVFAKGRDGGLCKFYEEVLLLWSGRSHHLASQLWKSRCTIHGDIMEDLGLHLRTTLGIYKGCNLGKWYRFPFLRNGTSRFKNQRENRVSALRHLWSNVEIIARQRKVLYHLNR